MLTCPEFGGFRITLRGSVKLPRRAAYRSRHCTIFCESRGNLRCFRVDWFLNPAVITKRLSKRATGDIVIYKTDDAAMPSSWRNCQLDTLVLRNTIMTNLEQRVKKLEASHRRWQATALALGAGLLCVAAMGAKLSGNRGVLRVQGIEVVNDQGERLVWIGQGSLGEGAIETYNNRGKRVTLITSNKRGDGLLNIANNDARRVFASGANDRGDGLLEVFNSNGVLVSLVGANYRGDGLINAANKHGKWVSAMAADKNGDGLVETFTPAQELTAKIP